MQCLAFIMGKRAKNAGFLPQFDFKLPEPVQLPAAPVSDAARGQIVPAASSQSSSSSFVPALAAPSPAAPVQRRGSAMATIKKIRMKGEPRWWTVLTETCTRKDLLT